MSTHDPVETAIGIAPAAPTRPAWTSVPNQVLFLLCLMYFIFYIDRVNISTAAPLIQKDLGLSIWMPSTRWGFAQGITHSFSRIGNALTPPLIAWLIAVVSWRGSFVVLGAASFVWMAVWVWHFRHNQSTHPRVTAVDLEQFDKNRTSSDERPKVPWPSLARRILPVTTVDFCYGWTLWLFLSWIPSFFFQNFHLNLKSSALFSAGVFLSGVIGDTLGGVVSDLSSSARAICAGRAAGSSPEACLAGSCS